MRSVSVAAAPKRRFAECPGRCVNDSTLGVGGRRGASSRRPGTGRPVISGTLALVPLNEYAAHTLCTQNLQADLYKFPTECAVWPLHQPCTPRTRWLSKWY